MKHQTSISQSVNNSTLNNAANNSARLDKLSQNNLKKIEEHVATFYSTPPCHSYCECHICKEKYEVLDKGKQFLRQTSSLVKIQTSKIKTFFKLMSAVNSKVAFQLQIPTMCFFEKGECKLMFKSKNEYITMQQNHQVSKKNIANFFVEANKKKAQGKMSHSNQKYNHIRHFGTLVPSYIHGVNDGSQKMMTAKNFYFHKDNRLQNDHTMVVEKSKNEQVAIVKYLDNKGLELLNEKQLRQLLKSAGNTQYIDFIQSYIKPHQVESQFLFSEYNGRKKTENLLMWNRSQIHVKMSINLINSYSKDYIPIETLQSYQEVLKQIPHQYILYQTYKMVRYLELVRSLRTNHLTTLWMKDEFTEICFFGILDFQYEEINNSETDPNQNYGIKEMMDKPFNELEGELWKMWERIKHKKLQQLSDKYTEKDNTITSRLS